MTIIQPNKNNHQSNFLISAMIIASIILSLFGVFLYNQLVNLRHETKKRENDLRQIEVFNAELKNRLYSILNENNLQSLINQQSLILDKNPQYLNVKPLAAN